MFYFFSNSFSASSSHSCNLLNLQYIKLIAASIVCTHITKGAYLFLLTKINMLNGSVGDLSTCIGLFWFLHSQINVAISRPLELTWRLLLLDKY